MGLLTSMGFLWEFGLEDSVPMGPPWASMSFSWDCHGNSMGLYRSHDSSMGLTWDSDGTSIELAWDFHGPWTSMGTS